MEYNWIMEKWTEYYISLYPYSIPFTFIIFWFWITHVDRVHLREKARNLGWKIQDKISKEIPDSNQLMIDYCYKQVNAMGELVAGVSDGLLNKKSSINVCVIKNNDSQTEFENVSEEIQTEAISMVDAIVSANIKDQNLGTDIELGKDPDKESHTDTPITPYYDIDVLSDESSQSSVDIKEKKKKRIFTTTRTKLDTEIFEKDMEEKKNHPKQKKRISSI
jgi:hypothetical protein